MKKTTLLPVTLIVILSLLIASCSKSTDQTTASSSTGSSNSPSGTSLSQVNMLLVGTLKLEDTPQALTSDEATKLLPLWQAYRSLSNSQTAAEAEVEALLKQIESTMTSDQVQAIKDMNLTSTDMMTLMQSMGGMGPQGTPNPQSTPSFDFQGGGFQSGNPPNDDAGGPPSSSSGGSTRNNFSGPMPGGGGLVIQGGPGIVGDAGSAAGLGGGPMMQGTPDPSMQSTAQARFSTQASQVNMILLNVLITKLEAKTTQ